MSREELTVAVNRPIAPPVDLTRDTVHQESRYWNSTSIPGYLFMVLLAYYQFVPLMQDTMYEKAIEPWGIEKSAKDNMERTATLLGAGLAMLAADVGPAILYRFLQLIMFTVGLRYPGFVDKVMETMEAILDWLFVYKSESVAELKEGDKPGYDESTALLAGAQSEDTSDNTIVDEITIPRTRKRTAAAIAHDLVFIQGPSAVGTLVLHGANTSLALLIYFFADTYARNEKAADATKCFETPGCVVPPDMPEITEKYANDFGKTMEIAVGLVMCLNYLIISQRSVSSRRLGSTSPQRMFPKNPGRKAGFRESLSFATKGAAAFLFKLPDVVLNRASAVEMAPSLSRQESTELTAVIATP